MLTQEIYAYCSVKKHEGMKVRGSSSFGLICKYQRSTFPSFMQNAFDTVVEAGHSTMQAEDVLVAVLLSLSESIPLIPDDKASISRLTVAGKCGGGQGGRVRCMCGVMQS